MPRAPMRPCAYPGCSVLVERGRCEKHASEAGSFVRNAAWQRLYDRSWQRRRARHLAASPWCEMCLAEGLYTAATDVHHVVAHRGDRAVFVTSPLQSLCKSCHSKVTAGEMVKGGVGQKVQDRETSSAAGLPCEKKSQCESSWGD